VGIPARDCIEMTGHVAPALRAEHWRSRRIFFLTAQVLNNDINSLICDARKISCLVIDESHHAQGNSAYSVAVKSLAAKTRNFRLLALSASPGHDKTKIQNIIHNLMISHLEVRGEEDVDVKSHTHTTTVDTVIPENLFNSISLINTNYITIEITIDYHENIYEIEK
jgi:ERCC4-related helicase